MNIFTIGQKLNDFMHLYTNGEGMVEVLSYLRDTNYPFDLSGPNLFIAACQTNNLELMTLCKELGYDINAGEGINGLFIHLNGSVAYDPERVVPHLISLGVEVTPEVIHLYDFVENAERDPVFQLLSQHYNKEKYGPHDSLETEKIGAERVRYLHEVLTRKLESGEAEACYVP